MTINTQYLVRRLAEANGKMSSYASDANAVLYWKGVQHTYHRILKECFTDWCKPGTPGYFVWYEEMTYEDALTMSSAWTLSGLDR
jgi:hypothetical protein